MPKFLEGAAEMVKACSAEVPAENNPGVQLGAILGAAAKRGRDKITIVASPAIFDLGACGWNSCWRNPRASRGRD